MRLRATAIPIEAATPAAAAADGDRGGRDRRGDRRVLAALIVTSVAAVTLLVRDVRVRLRQHDVLGDRAGAADRDADEPRRPATDAAAAMTLIVECETLKLRRVRSPW